MKNWPLRGEPRSIVKNPPPCKHFKRTKAAEYSFPTDAFLFISGIGAEKHIYLWKEKAEKDIFRHHEANVTHGTLPKQSTQNASLQTGTG